MKYKTKDYPINKWRPRKIFQMSVKTKGLESKKVKRNDYFKLSDVAQQGEDHLCSILL